MDQCELKVFGIRHHGAGSASRLIEALQLFQPDTICIELPQESEALLGALSQIKFQPPIAFLFYNKKNPDHCFYLPMAVFSPEFQAIQYAFFNHIQIIPIDLPAKHSLVYANFKNNTEAELNKEQRKITSDPLGYLARQQGFKDTERWWDKYIEQWSDHLVLFDIIQQLMTTLRSLSNELDDEETLIREQFMRQQIRQSIANGSKKIAVVCGAWHGPLLTLDRIQKKETKLKFLASVDIHQCLIPWSYERLSNKKSYSAGIESPSWYDALFYNRTTAISTWLTQAARVLRSHKMNVSPAEIIDAELLAINLSMIRGLAIAGIDELMEAAVTCFGKGDDTRIQLILNQVLNGNLTGKVEVNASSLPMVQDFFENLKSLKLQSYWASGNKENLDLDLRKERHLHISRLLYKTLLLDIPWAKSREIEIKAQGNFHEFWSFKWNPELEIALIHAALIGNTVDDAVRNKVIDVLKSSHDISTVAGLLTHALKAGLNHIWPLLAERINLLSIEIEDIESLAGIIQPLVSNIQYGDLHLMDTQVLIDIFNTILPRIILSFGDQCVFISDVKANAMLEILIMINVYFYNHDKEYNQLWQEEIYKIAYLEKVHPLIRGKCWNILLSEHNVSNDELIIEIQSQFLIQNDASKSAQWLEGFLFQSTAFYLLQDNIIQVLDQWLKQLEELEFKTTLPLLRRIFSQLPDSERIRIKTKISKQRDVQSINEIREYVDQERVNKLNLLYDSIVGISSSDSKTIFSSD